MIKFKKGWAVLYVWLAICPVPEFTVAQQISTVSILDSVRLKLVYPADSDTIDFDRVRYAGSVIPTAKVWVQEQNVIVYPSGAFVGLVELEPGMNTINFTIQDSMGVLTDSLHIIRPYPVFSYPEVPTIVNPTSIQPDNDIHISPGANLEVEFQASPGGTATFSIDKVAKNVSMVELSERAAKGIKGLYRGVVLIPELNKYKPKQVEFKFRGKNRRVFKFKSKCKIHILPQAVPLVGLTSDSVNVVRTSPEGEIWMELPSNIKMQIIGERDGIKKVRLSENVVGYISSRSLKTLPAGSILPTAIIGSIGGLRIGDWIQLRINLTEKVPFKIEQFLEPAAMEITFYQAFQGPQWISYPYDDETIRIVRWRQQSEQTVVLRIELNQNQQWGYLGRYVGRQFWLNIRRSPQWSASPDSLLKGLIITVDAGHGGEHEGAVSPTGLLEKEVNLKYANIVADLLEAEGAKVYRTRTRDISLSLSDRVMLAREHQSHIFVSLHNNSISPATNPLRPRGTSTYYTVPHSQAIARSVYQRLLALGLNPFGRVLSNYFVTRQTSLISFLVEGIFMTHPEDEMLLLDDQFVDRLALAVVNGIKDFLKEIKTAELDFPKNKLNKAVDAESEIH